MTSLILTADDECPPLPADAQACWGQARDLVAATNPKLRPLALPLFRKALRLAPDNVPILLDMAHAHWMLGDQRAALDCCEEAVRRAPDSVRARVRLTFWQIPHLHPDEASVSETRDRYREKLGELEALVDRLDADALRDAARGDIVASMPGALRLTAQTYDVRDLQALYGRILCRVMATAHPDWTTPPRPEPLAGRRIRLGVVSANFSDNAHWRMATKGWIGQIDPARIDLHCYALGKSTPAALDHVRARGARVAADRLDFEQWCTLVRDDKLDVLFYPELGDNRIQQRMAALRLAPVQCVSWVNPVTSGLPTIDYFLSGDLFEPPGADAHYTEQLVRLPNVASYLDPIDWSATDEPRAAFGLRDDAVVYLCPQYLFKCQPRYDWIFARIAASVPNSQFVFNSRLCPPRATRLFLERLKATFTKQGLDFARHVVMHDAMAQPRYRRFTELCDIFLDNIGYTGGTTTVEAGIVPALPIVTHGGTFMRGRMSLGFLKMIGMGDMIAESVEAFVDLAIRLGQDPETRRAMSARIARHRDTLFRDDRCIAGLHAFLERAAIEAAARE